MFSNTQLPKPCPQKKNSTFQLHTVQLNQITHNPKWNHTPITKRNHIKPQIHSSPRHNTGHRKQLNQPTRSWFTEIRTSPKCNKAGNLLRIAPRQWIWTQPHSVMLNSNLSMHKGKKKKTFFFLNHWEP